MKKYLNTWVFLAWAMVTTLPVYSQSVLTGRVWIIQGSSEPLPAEQASVFSPETQNGAFTDAEGRFRLAWNPAIKTLIIRYVGAKPDTLPAPAPDTNVDIYLKSDATLATVNIVGVGQSSHFSSISPQQMELLTEKELFKAACCNLSESFETNPSVNIAFTDAVTGTRQIEFLGLAGKYTMLSQESMPGIRGLGLNQGLNLIPGPWVESIQISKGAGSVVNGFEGMTGQINYELKKPIEKERLFLNGYQNLQGRSELNLNLLRKNEKGSGHGLLLHANSRYRSMDQNFDGFLDQPTGKQGNLTYRWMTPDRKGWSAQANARVVWDDQTAGEDPMHHIDHEGYQLYGVNIRTRRAEAWGKTGYIFPQKPYQSFGIQASVSHHDIQSVFGQRTYEGQQQTGYVNAIFQSIIGTTDHSYRIGASLIADAALEQVNAEKYLRREATPGVFADYSYQHLERFSVVAGIRADYSSLFGLFVTPRLNLRYAPDKHTTLRFAAGRGQRTPQVFAENMGVFATSRTLVLPENPYQRGAEQFVEVAWNVGVHATRTFRLDYREGAFNVDFYRTSFQRQVILDLDQSPGLAAFYAVEGGSYATNFQAEFQYELMRRFDVRLAYRWTEVRVTYANGLMRQAPLTPRHRAFANFAYATRDGWSFDATVQYHGRQRIPDTFSNPEAFRFSGESPDFLLLNAQVSKKLGKRWDVYIGGENLGNFRQLRPILGSFDPYGPYFDSMLVWGPIMGRNVYGGFRFRIADES